MPSKTSAVATKSVALAHRITALVASGFLVSALAACSAGGGGSFEGPGSGAGADGGTTKTATASDPVVGFWANSKTNCNNQFGLAYGFALCSSKKVSGVEQFAHPEYGNFRWLGEGNYSVSSDKKKVTLTLKRTVVDPSAIRGDVNSATLVLKMNAAGNLEVEDATEMPECTGLELQRTEEVTDADCDDTASSSSGGCTADVDCGSGKRCERSTGKCLTKLGG